VIAVTKKVDAIDWLVYIRNIPDKVKPFNAE
jgi:hypothetical protein